MNAHQVDVPAVLVQAVMAMPLLASAGLWAGSAKLGRWLPPATAVRALTAAALVSALGTGFVLAVAAFLVLAQVPVVAVVGHWSVPVLRSGHLVPAAVGVVCGAAVALLSASVVGRAAGTGRDMALAALLCRRLRPDVDGLVVVEDDIPEAYALAGLRGRVVVSTAMLAALPANERAVLLAHETAHLRHRHHLYVQLTELAAAANPALRPAARAVRAAVERWADEVAAADVGDRGLAARALARAALARAAATRRPERSPREQAIRAAAVPSAALGAVDAHVADRALALLRPPPAPRRALAAVLVAATLATGVASALTEHVVETRFELAQLAYGHQHQHAAPSVVPLLRGEELARVNDQGPAARIGQHPTS